ncbi:guanine deaminase [Paxillus ammoniavirescens]|nr:guanine deaminase [Paxillus ammoniavirescens]
MTTIYYGPVINPQTLTTYLALPRCLIAVGPDGNISWTEDDIIGSKLQETITQHGFCDGEYTLVHLQPGEFILPGFIDTHIHACQVPNLGVGGEDELLDWLESYTFPTESRFKDLNYAKRAYPDIVRRVIAFGTTTSCYYGSLHLEATKLLASIVQQKGQRAFVGKCNMNWHCPPYYTEPSVEESMKTTLDLLDHISKLPQSPAKEPLVHPIITPRFAISCTEELLTKLGELADTLPHVAIQTHISENQKEVQDSMELFQTDSYAAIYEKFGLLRSNTILGHGVWLTEKEMELIAKHGAGVAHCPTSNFYLSSGMARVGMLLDYGVKVGLGTDVGGGYNPSILYAIQMASTASKMLSIQAESEKARYKHHRGKRGHGHKHGHKKHPKSEGLSSPASPESESEAEGHRKRHGCCDHSPKKEGQFTNKKLGIATLLYLATKGGAEVCCLQDRIGSFEKGKAFDALVVSVRDETGNPAVWGYNVPRDLDEGQYAQSADLNLKQWLERFLFCGDDRNIRKVIVQGALIGGQEHQG